jgi:hypothetical protein
MILKTLTLESPLDYLLERFWANSYGSEISWAAQGTLRFWKGSAANTTLSILKCKNFSQGAYSQYRLNSI